MSNLQVLVQWKNSTVQGGDNIECNITFRNICSSIDSSPATQLPSSALERDSRTELLPPSVEKTLSRKPPSHAVLNFRPRCGSHRSTYSIDTSLSIRQASAHSVQNKVSKISQEKDHRFHKRSISIVSIEDEGLPDKGTTTFPPVSSKRLTRVHGRTLSFQPLPRASSMNLNPISGKQQ